MKLVGSVVAWLHNGQPQWGLVEADSTPRDGRARRLLIRSPDVHVLLAKPPADVVVLWTPAELAELVNSRLRSSASTRWADSLNHLPIPTPNT